MQGLPPHIRVMSNSGESTASRVTDWANREIMETQSIHIFTFLITLTALQVLTRSQAAVPCCDSSHLYTDDKLILRPMWGKGDGQWRLLERGTVGYVCIWKQQKKCPLIGGFTRIIRLEKTYIGKSTGLGDRFHVPNNKMS